MTITTSPDRTVADAPQTAPAPGGAGPGRRPPRKGGHWRDLRPSFSGKHGRALAIALVALVVVALAVPIGLSRLSTGGGSSSEGSVAGVSPAQVGRDASGAPRSAGSAGSSGSSDSSGAAQSPQGQSGSKAPAGSTLTSDAAAALDGTKIARAAWIGLQVTDLAGSAGRARIIASGAGGTVLNEDIVTAVDPVNPGSTGNPPSGGASGTGPDGIPTTDAGGVSGYGSTGAWSPVGLHQARLTLSVPAEKLDIVLTQLSALGTVSYRSAQAEDVTATYIDTQARIGPARDSIERVRALMAKATDLQQLLVLESELTRRQSDLDALTQQLADLDKRTTMSEVTVAMWTPAAAAVVDEGTGAVGGLRGAWQALLSSLTVILTGLAVLLPWLLLIGLGAFITLRVMRRRRTSAATPAAMAPTAAVPATAVPATAAPATAEATTAPATTAPTQPVPPATPSSTD
jgi:hypothetical protein